MPDAGLARRTLDGKRLARYEIVKEEPGDGTRWFSVRPSFENPSSESEVRYVVLGQDPIGVFRDSDYSQVGSM